MKMHIMDYVALQRKIESIIKEELNKAGVNLDWDYNDLTIPHDLAVVIEASASGGKLSSAIIDHYFHSKQPSAELAHFTSLDKFASILDSKSIRLSCLKEVLGQGEFKTFAKDFALNNLLNQTTGRSYAEELAEQIFFTSFSNLFPKDEKVLWQRFGRHGAGVKIHFELRVNRSRSELRPILYSSHVEAASTLINQISKRIKSECKRDFILKGISRIGAFYLNTNSGLDVEEETRLIVNTWGEGIGHNLIVTEGGKKYFPIEIENPDNDFCYIRMISVEAGSQCQIEDVSMLLEKFGLGHVAVSKTSLIKF